MRCTNIYDKFIISVTYVILMVQMTSTGKQTLLCYSWNCNNDCMTFRDINALKGHFRKFHFVCDEGNCANEYLTNVFKSEIDLKGE